MKKIKSILLIDDDTISSWLNQTMLERTELVETIETIFDGQSAIDYLKQRCANTSEAKTSCPDLILLDLDMPVVNGFDVLDALQQSEACSWLISDRIIVLTTTINPRDLERARSYHIYDFLIKPLTDTKISGVLKHFINRSAEGSTPDAESNTPEQEQPKAKPDVSDRDAVARAASASAGAGENKSEGA